jgi:dihydrofolate reductase
VQFVTNKGATVRELLVDFITSFDGYASGEGWPGWWGLQGPEYLAWLEDQPEVTYLMGANTYQLMSGFAAGEMPDGTDEFSADEEASVGGLTGASKVVFSSSLDAPLTWANSTLVRDDAVDAVRAMKEEGSGVLSTIGSLSLCRSLLRGGLVDRFRVVMFPVITGATGSERIYDGYPDVALDMIESRTFDGRIQLVEYRPRVLDHPPLATADARRASWTWSWVEQLLPAADTLDPQPRAELARLPFREHDRGRARGGRRDDQDDIALGAVPCGSTRWCADLGLEVRAGLHMGRSRCRQRSDRRLITRAC